MAVAMNRDERATAPMAALVLGGAGLLPPLIAIFVRLSTGVGSDLGRFAMLIGLAYVALILSFLGGLWWGVVAASGRTREIAPWLFLAVIPSLLALFLQTLSGWYPGPSVVALGLVVAGTLLVDRKLCQRGFAPPWWMRLRIPLSLGLAIETLILSALI